MAHCKFLVDSVTWHDGAWMLSVRARRSERLLRSSRAWRPRVISHLPMSEMDSYSLKLWSHLVSSIIFLISLCRRSGSTVITHFVKKKMELFKLNVYTKNDLNIFNPKPSATLSSMTVTFSGSISLFIRKLMKIPLERSSLFTSNASASTHLNPECENYNRNF